MSGDVFNSGQGGRHLPMVGMSAAPEDRQDMIDGFYRLKGKAFRAKPDADFFMRPAPTAGLCLISVMRSIGGLTFSLFLAVAQGHVIGALHFVQPADRALEFEAA